MNVPKLTAIKNYNYKFYVYKYLSLRIKYLNYPLGHSRSGANPPAKKCVLLKMMLLLKLQLERKKSDHCAMF
jgi:hypothetical protein